jgi:hypothetical protein
MARVRFEIKADSTGVSFTTYNTANQKFLQLLRELDSAISGKSGGMVKWYIADLEKNGTLSLEIESRMKKPPKRKRKRREIYDTAPTVAHSLVTGFENIEKRGISPPYLSEFGLQKLGDMMQLLHENGARGFIATAVDEHRSVEVTEKAANTLQELLPPRREEEGSVEGTLETVSVHGDKKFIVYDSLTKKGVTCIISRDDLLERAKGVLGSKVAVSGIVHFNIKDEPVRITAVSDLRVFGHGKRLPRASELTGSDPDFTGDLSTDEYIESIRRG